MITIREIKPIKISGISSFLISFQYEPKAVEAVKSLPTYYYHKDITGWEIPANDLALAIDTLTFLDNIQLQLLSDESEVVEENTDLTSKEIEEFKFKPYAHQIDAINFGLQKKHKKWLLLDSMGLG